MKKYIFKGRFFCDVKVKKGILFWKKESLLPSEENFDYIVYASSPEEAEDKFKNSKLYKNDIAYIWSAFDSKEGEAINKKIKVFKSEDIYTFDNLKSVMLSDDFIEYCIDRGMDIIND